MVSCCHRRVSDTKRPSSARASPALSISVTAAAQERVKWDKVFAHMEIVGDEAAGSDILYSLMKAARESRLPAVTRRLDAIPSSSTRHEDGARAGDPQPADASPVRRLCPRVSVLAVEHRIAGTRLRALGAQRVIGIPPVPALP